MYFLYSCGYNTRLTYLFNQLKIEFIGDFSSVFDKSAKRTGKSAVLQRPRSELEIPSSHLLPLWPLLP